ncbi:Vitamin B12 import ATP-binding protein BtuD [Streptomyces microflavus]
MVFQNFALYPSMTNRANIGFPLKLENPREDNTAPIEATARMLGIEHVLDRYPAQLSGGERQRVAMGRAISRRPSVFLMDEPLSNLDAKLRNHLRAEIALLTRELGVTTVYATHDQAEAMSLGDRVAVMRGGVLQQVSPPRDVYALPDNVFVAAFIGTPRINLLQAVVHAPLEGRMSIDLGRQRLALPNPSAPTTSCSASSRAAGSSWGCARRRSGSPRPGQARPGEVALSGIVEHVEYQGHEALVHLNTGSQAAIVPDLESAQPRAMPRAPQGRRGPSGRGARRSGRPPRPGPAEGAGRGPDQRARRRPRRTRPGPGGGPHPGPALRHLRRPGGAHRPRHAAADRRPGAAAGGPGASVRLRPLRPPHLPAAAGCARPGRLRPPLRTGRTPPGVTGVSGSSLASEN